MAFPANSFSSMLAVEAARNVLGAYFCFGSKSRNWVSNSNNEDSTTCMGKFPSFRLLYLNFYRQPKACACNEGTHDVFS